MDDLIQDIADNSENFLSKYNGSKKDNIAFVIRRLRESLIQINQRYKDYKNIETEIRNLHKPEDMGEKLHFLQLDLVNKVEAFHQQVYSTISVLILVLNFVGINNKRSNHPISSVSKFLDYLVKNVFSENPEILEQIEILKQSKDYRAKFVDHPQQHQLYEWSTYGYEDQVYIIYYKQLGNEIYAIRGNPDPLSKDFIPPVNTDDFYVAPDKNRTFNAVEVIVSALIDLK